MGAIGRSPFVGVLVGLVVALVQVTVPGGTAVAAATSTASTASCDDRLTEQLECWAEVIKDGPVVITLDAPLPYEEVGERQRHDIETLRADRHPLVVQVRKGKNTGEGGTALLVLAEERLVHPGARIDRLSPGPFGKLKAAGLCAGQDQLCELVKRDDDGPATLTGKELVDAGFAADQSTHVDAIAPVPGAKNPPRSGPSTSPSEKSPSEKARSQEPAGETVGQGNSGYSGATWTVLWMGLLLALLLLAFVIVIRRSRGPVAVGRRALPGRTGGGTPTRAAPAHAARGGDESTTRLRVAAAPAPRHGRQVGARPAHARTAVVRTELHPQGYVELDRVLRRAVWAEPGRPPPVPGGLVDVADARERDCDVLYAFPPTAARHAKGTPR
ncbi:hypothetical protein [Streptomyces adelaidensis]|uniref:hypothetical protein n=1 Tax=Streptomyces adelaidensis TaxID=2796465 RepID=UPI001904795D|nr:hypothetical protein [Streptomyces adelaidensis]